MRDRPSPQGCLVLSLDFELAWGGRRRQTPATDEQRVFQDTRETIPRILETFGARGIRGTWATVGFLFAGSKSELEAHAPAIRPSYHDARLDAYAEPIGDNESTDPTHFGSSLVEAIRDAPGQEVATHTFSHYYCGERGQTPEAFQADLRAAKAIAAARGIHLRSIVFPRNQHNPAYDPILIGEGIVAYRGNPTSWLWRFEDTAGGRHPTRRVGRWIDTYVDVDGHHATAWKEVMQPNGLANVRASRFLRPLSRSGPARSLRLSRIARGIREAARTGCIFHLWWHPHNFGRQPAVNLAFLTDVLGEFERCRDTYGMHSLTMAEVATRARDLQRGGELR
jgi:peptidoglycan/xylan/chitin deacetylase (PgdA/CDA1 family)